MLPEALDLEIVTPERHVLHETVQMIELPGKEGYMGILPGHAPLITELGIGELIYRKGKEIEYLTAFRGYAEVLPDRVIVLAEICERAEEISVERARAALGRARGRLGKSGSEEIDWDRARYSLQRAITRLQVASKGGFAAISPDETRYV